VDEPRTADAGFASGEVPAFRALAHGLHMERVWDAGKSVCSACRSGIAVPYALLFCMTTNRG
jgi:hypothetical protein